jgi:D-glucosaminate-6-phosphate ammonia-lyase
MIPPAPIVSAAGFTTTLGGGAMCGPARDAIAEAAAATWRIDDLQRWAGAEIAALTGAESGWITSGAAAGLALGAAACIAGTDPSLSHSLPHPPAGARAEIVMQRGHRNAYDRVVRTAGGRIVEVGYPWNEGVGLTYEWELEAALGERTAAILHAAVAEPSGIPLERVCDIAARHGVPVIVDAAAELPPASNLRAFVDAGAALVAFSGGKAIRGPQGSGILAGRADLIAAVRLQTADMDVDPVGWAESEGAEPPHHGLGRSHKVGKEQIVGAVAALQDFARRDHDAQAREMGAWLDEVRDALGDRVPARVDRGPHFYPRLAIALGEPAARRWAAELAGGERAVVVPHHPLARGELVICPEAISEADRELVRSALLALSQAAVPA